MGDALIRHNCLDISEVKVDQRRQINQIRDAGNCLLRDLIRFLKCFRHGRSAIHNLKQLVIRNHDQRIDGFLEL